MQDWAPHPAEGDLRLLPLQPDQHEWRFSERSHSDAARARFAPRCASVAAIHGFKINSGEYKLMGLARYGQPRFADLILARLLGVAWRSLRGSDPFYAWNGEAPAAMQGWVPKSAVDDRRSASFEAAMRPTLL
jgi:predicted NodU family carbamoyl transferase